MKCPKCDVVMMIGIALPGARRSDVRYCFYAPTIVDHGDIIKCVKCPQCGYSDDDVSSYSPPASPPASDELAE